MERPIGKGAAGLLKYGGHELNGIVPHVEDLLEKSNDFDSSQTNGLGIQPFPVSKRSAQDGLNSGNAVVQSSSLIDRPELEQRLVRDCLYACQGIDGELIKFDEGKEAYVVLETLDIPRSVRTLVSEICELGFLYRKVESFVDSVGEGSLEAVGVTVQAFCFALRNKLADYRQFLTSLEKGSHIPIPTPYRSGSAFSSQASVDPQSDVKYLSLLRLSILSYGALQRMHIMAVVVDRCRRLKGGALAGALELQLRHGDPVRKKIIMQILKASCVPILEILQNWVWEGVLRDPFNDFFVVNCPGVTEDRLWQNMYRLEKGMLPGFFPTSLGMTVLRAGKSINFLRRCCQEQEWASAQQKDPTAVASALVDLGRGRTEALGKMVDTAAQHIDSRLLKVIMEKFHLMEHCLAIKRYLLVSRIDFLRELMDRVSTELSRPSKTVSVFQLQSGVVATVSSLSYDNDVLQSLHVRMLPASAEETKGWQVFSLDYTVSSPLKAVITEETMIQYRRIFNFLWRLNRVICAVETIFWSCKSLSSLKVRLGRLKNQPVGGYRRTLDTQRAGSRGKHLFALQGSSEGESNTRQDGERVTEETGGWNSWKDQYNKLAEVESRCLSGFIQMKFFLRKMQEYVKDAVESSWATFEKSAKAARNLDEIIFSHEQFVTTLTQNEFLGEHSPRLKRSLQGMWDACFSLQKTCSRLDVHVEKAVTSLEEGEGENSLTSDFLLSVKNEILTIAKQFESHGMIFLFVLGPNDPLELKVSSYFAKLSQKVSGLF